MYFTGDQASDLETTALDILETLLKDGFAASDVAPKFKKFGGVRITRDPRDGFEWYTKDKRPFIFIQLDGDELFGWQKVVDGQLHEGTRHELTLGVEAICNQSCADAEQTLRAALRRVLEKSYFTLRGAGLEGSKVKALRPEEHPDRRNPHQITATAYTL